MKTAKAPLWLSSSAAALVALAAAVILALTGARASGLDGIKQALKSAEVSHPSALWHVVHDLCMTDMAARGAAAPCAEVSLAGGYAVVRDVEHPTQLLLVPITRMSGIEAPQLQLPDSPNYWQAAWSARSWLQKAAGRPIPRQAVGLAINSAATRTQDQLHIHIDCVRPDVQAELVHRQAEIGPHWLTLAPSVLGVSFRARWISGAELGGNDPFKLVARTDPRARADMGLENLFVMGAVRDGRPGFILLSRRDDPRHGDVVAAENLLDHHCRVLS